MASLRCSRLGRITRSKEIQQHNTTQSTRRRRHHDVTLDWARSNPQLAQTSLRPPNWDVPKDSKFAYQKENTLEDYTRWRRWPHSVLTSELHEMTMNLCSHVLSAPLTLAMFFSQIECIKPGRMCCVGARAEATLPVIYWKEFLLLTASVENDISEPINTSLDFLGPDISTRTPDATISLDSKSSISLSWYFSGLRHETKTKWDAYILFNPGLGHDNLITGWRPTLDMLVAERQPLLLTAHSSKDAERDSSRFRHLYNLDVQYRRNPFASRITYEDPFDQGHIVRPNQFVASLFCTASP